MTMMKESLLFSSNICVVCSLGFDVDMEEKAMRVRCVAPCHPILHFSCIDAKPCPLTMVAMLSKLASCAHFFLNLVRYRSRLGMYQCLGTMDMTIAIGAWKNMIVPRATIYSANQEYCAASC